MTRSIRKRGFQAFVLGALGIALVSVSVVLAITTQANLRARQSQVAETHINSVEVILKENFDTYVNALYGARGLFDASREVEREEWRAFFQGVDLEQRFPGAFSIAYHDVVSAEQRTAYIQALQEDPLVSESVLAHLEKLEPKEQGVYVLTKYLNPPDRWEQYLAFDLSANPVYADTLDWARDAGQPVVSAVSTLFDGEEGFIIALPVYQKGAVTRTLADRQQFVRGYVVAYFKTPGVFQTIFASVDQVEGFALRIKETVSGAEKPMFFWGSWGLVPDPKKVIQSTTFENWGRRWGIEYVIDPSYALTPFDRSAPWLVLGAGLLLTTILLLFILSLITSRARAERLAESMTVELRKAQVSLQAQLTLFSSLLERLPVGVRITDTKGEGLFMNREARRILGPGTATHPTPVTVVRDYSLVKDDGTPYPTERLPGVMTTRTGKISSQNDIYVKRPDGTLLALDVHSFPVRGSRGQLQSVGIVIRDVTEARAVERVKDEFFHITSHQLKAPIAAYRWLLELLLSGTVGELNQKQREALEEMDVASTSMRLMVNTLLNASRVEKGAYGVEPSSVDVPKVIEDSIQDLRLDVRRRGIHLDIHTEDELPVIETDPNLLRVILQNLISNAVKYSREGARVYVSATRQGKDQILFEVRDTGRGIPAQDQVHIFEKYFRASNAPKGTGSTGLGLFIVKRLVEELRGHVSFESVEKKGSTFRLELPLKARVKARMSSMTLA